jgi:hypothetical protein
VGLVLAGRQAVEIRETGVATPIGGEAFELIEGGEYVFAVREGPGGPEPWPITDPDTVGDPYQGRLRLIHLAALARNIAASLTPPDRQDPVDVAFPFSPTVSRSPRGTLLTATAAR